MLPVAVSFAPSCNETAQYAYALHLFSCAFTELRPKITQPPTCLDHTLRVKFRAGLIHWKEPGLKEAALILFVSVN